MDSPKLLMDATKRYYAGYSGELPTWRAESWPDWFEVRDKVEPESEAVWLSDFAAEDCVKWAKENAGIVWYGHRSFGARVAKLGNLSFFGAGTDASLQILQESGKRSIVASIKAHGTGKNLQVFNQNLIANPPSDGGAWEQLLGRTHRFGQTKDVTTYVYRHTPELKDCISNAESYANYTYGITGQAQKLLYANKEWQ